MSNTDPTIPIPAMNRYAVATGLREFANFIEEHPDLPVPFNPEIHMPIILDTDDDERAEVDRIAAILGVEPTYVYGNDHYRAVAHFGPLVFKVTCISDEYMTKYHAKMALVDVIDEHGDVSTEEWPV